MARQRRDSPKTILVETSPGRLELLGVFLMIGELGTLELDLAEARRLQAHLARVLGPGHSTQISRLTNHTSSGKHR